MLGLPKSLKHAFEPSLFEPKSPLPGNGIFRPENKRPEKARHSFRAFGKCYFRPHAQGVEPGLFEPQSPLPGNGFLKAETKSSKRLAGSRTPLQRQNLARQTPPIRGLFGENREISVRPRVRGGLGRTRTSNQAVMRPWSAIARPNHNEISIR